MPQAIVTKFIGPGTVRGSRIKATAWAGSCTVPYSHRLDVDGNHRAAAKALAEKFGWVAEWRESTLPDGRRVYLAAPVAFRTAKAEA